MAKSAHRLIYATHWLLPDAVNSLDTAICSPSPNVPQRLHAFIQLRDKAMSRKAVIDWKMPRGVAGYAYYANRASSGN